MGRAGTCPSCKATRKESKRDNASCNKKSVTLPKLGPASTVFPLAPCLLNSLNFFVVRCFSFIVLLMPTFSVQRCFSSFSNSPFIHFSFVKPQGRTIILELLTCLSTLGLSTHILFMAAATLLLCNLSFSQRHQQLQRSMQLTLYLACISAPACWSHCTTAKWPLLAASISAVSPICAPKESRKAFS